MNRREKILLITITVSTLVLIIVTILNQSINTRITYYETREGLINRLINESCEEEYRELLNISKKYYVIGLICLIICLSSIGLYISEEKNKSRDSVSSIYHQFYEYLKQLYLS